MSTPSEPEPAVGVGDDARRVPVADSIGASLRQGRERLGLSVSQVEARLKIRERYLLALEDERWDALPGYAFTKAFVRSYAQLLGLDGQALVDRFKSIVQDPSEAELAPTLHQAEAADRSEILGALARLLPRPSRRSAVRVATAGALLALVAGALYGSGAIKEAAKAPHAPARTAPSRVAGLRPKPARVRRSQRPTPSPRSKPTAPAPLSLQVVPTGRVWVCLIAYPSATAPGGAVEIAGIMLPVAPSSRLEGANHYVVTFGNDLARMVIDGTSYPVARVPANVVSYLIARDGSFRVIQGGAAPACS